MPEELSGQFNCASKAARLNSNAWLWHFENGADSDVAIRDRIPAGGQTRALDLPGDNRRIASVEVWYGKADWGKAQAQSETLRTALNPTSVWQLDRQVWLPLLSQPFRPSA